MTLAGVDPELLGRQLRQARETAGMTAAKAAALIDIPVDEYLRVEAGQRPVKGDELIALADRFGVRVAAITGLGRIRSRATFRTCGNMPAAVVQAAADKLCAYLELDNYLDEHAIPEP